MQELGIRHIRTHPYTPRTNGKAEAMVKILLSGCAHTRSFAGDDERSEALQPFVEFYNHSRPRAA
jgi:transposase InsO family protein